MLEKCKNAQERWGGVNDLIDQLLAERQELLVQFCGLAGEKSFDETDEQQTRELKSLCEVLVDYSSAGHFEVYEQLVREAEAFNDAEALTSASREIGKIDLTTDAILDFNDKYQETDDMSSLSADLSELGIALEARFEAEDRMIQVVHSAHDPESA
ncbi:MAG: sigma D regulator [bacterium]